MLKAKRRTWECGRESVDRKNLSVIYTRHACTKISTDTNSIRTTKDDGWCAQLAYDRVYSVCVLSAAKKAYFGILPDGEPEIKGLSIAESNSPKILRTNLPELVVRDELLGFKEEVVERD